MNRFAIIETDDGVSVETIAPDSTGEETALQNQGIVVDPGPYLSYEDAYDALLDLRDDDADEERD